MEIIWFIPDIWDMLNIRNPPAPSGRTAAESDVMVWCLGESLSPWSDVLMSSKSAMGLQVYWYTAPGCTLSAYPGPAAEISGISDISIICSIYSIYAIYGPCGAPERQHMIPMGHNGDAMHAECEQCSNFKVNILTKVLWFQDFTKISGPGRRSRGIRTGVLHRISMRFSLW